MRQCCSNEAIFYRNDISKTKEENYRNNINFFSYNHNNKKLNKKQNNDTSPNITPYDPKNTKMKKIFSPSSRIIILNQKNKLKKSESTNKIIKRSNQFYQNQNTLTIKSTNIIKEKEKKQKKIKIPLSTTHHMKSISLDANNNNKNNNSKKIIDEKKKNNKKYLINNVVNEQFNNAIIKNSKKEGTTISENENLEISVQSMNDSKMMELAKNYIKQEDNLNRNEITQILNCKKGWI